MTDEPPGLSSGIALGSPEYWRIAAAMVAAGFSVFAIMNAVQPLMPIFVAEFGITAASASLSLSLTIAALAVAMLGTARLSDRLGRKPVMAMSLLLSSVTMLLTSVVADWGLLLVLRACCGIAIAGVPAVVITYLSEEMAPASRAAANGIYVSGAALGGMAGRLISGHVADLYGWHAGLAAVGWIGLAAAAAFLVLLPKSRNFTPSRVPPAAELRAYIAHLRDPHQRRLYISAFLLMGAMVSVYNYLGFRLLAAPFGLDPVWVNGMFLLYAVGILIAPPAGALAQRHGETQILQIALVGSLCGMGLMLSERIVVVMLGLTLFTAGFFAAHSIASGWAARSARTARTQASTLYLLAYYMGGALIGWIGGQVWQVFGWPGLCMLIIAGLVQVGWLIGQSTGR